MCDLRNGARESATGWQHHSRGGSQPGISFGSRECSGKMSVRVFRAFDVWAVCEKLLGKSDKGQMRTRYWGLRLLRAVMLGEDSQLSVFHGRQGIVMGRASLMLLCSSLGESRLSAASVSSHVREKRFTRSQFP